jgi:hypothetical protein
VSHFITDEMVEVATMVLLGKAKDPVPGVDWWASRQWRVNKVREKMRKALEAVYEASKPANPAPSANCAGDAGECAFNGACMYACGSTLPAPAPEAVAGAIDARRQEARSSQIITLCGSARFERLFKAWNEALTMAGHTVFSLTAYPSDKAGVKQWYTEEQKTALDAAHFRKIEASDAIFVLNLHAYIGESTLREIEYARKLGKAVYFLESWGKGHGIGGSHTDGAQRAAEADELALPTASPIDTTTRSGSKDPWASRLLGPAGPLRSAIVDLTKSAALAVQAETGEG